jgi:hypothetical protein
MWGTPLSLRVGRQELVFGSEWLLGNTDGNAYYTGLSYDAIRLTFANDMFKADAFAGKLVETYGNFGKGDEDLYGVYGSYIGIEDVTIDAYWLYLVDNRFDGNEIDFHTFGLRGAGTISGFDFDAEVAYQLGDINGQPSACPFGFGEADVDYEGFGANAEVGYTFDVAWQPRPFVMFAYFDGGEPDVCKRSNDRTLPFNRLFSDKVYSVFLDTNRNLTNLIYYGAGVQVMPTECVSLELAGAYLDLENDTNLGEQSEWGWEIDLSGSYHYSDDLVFSAGYSHFFGGDWDRTEDCPIYDWDGETSTDFDYFYLETEITF